MRNASMCYRVDYIPAGATRLLTKQPAEVSYAYTSLPTSGSAAVLYDGQDANGDTKVNMAAGQGAERAIAPPVPLYFGRGIFVSAPSGGGGLTVQWRELPQQAQPGPDEVVVVAGVVTPAPAAPGYQQP